MSRLERSSPQLDKDALLRKLLEAEMDSNAAAKQVSALRETINQISRNVSVNSTGFKRILNPEMNIFLL